MRRIGILMTFAADDLEGRARVTAFMQALQQRGWADGRNVRIDARWGLNAGDLRKFAAELVELAPDVIPTSALGGVAGSLIACHGVTEVSPHPIGRVARVQRPAIKADIRPKTTQLDEALRAVVTRFAERLERTEPELIDVAAVRFDVIADCRRGYNAALEAKLTKRMLQQLVLPDPRPAPRAVPSPILSGGRERS